MLNWNALVIYSDRKIKAGRNFRWEKSLSLGKALDNHGNFDTKTKINTV
jgi:hypothetical protein